MSRYQLDTGSETVTLHPALDFQYKQEVIRAEHITTQQKLVNFKFGKSRMWDVPIQYVPSSDAKFLNKHWELQTPMTFTVDSTDTYSVMIKNGSNPIGKVMKPYTTTFEGLLNLVEL